MLLHQDLINNAPVDVQELLPHSLNHLDAHEPVKLALRFLRCIAAVEKVDRDGGGEPCLGNSEPHQASPVGR